MSTKEAIDMFDYDEFGLFYSVNHIENFLFYMQTLYYEDFTNNKFNNLPENELAFLYLISELFDYPLISENQDIIQLLNNLGDETNFLDENQGKVLIIAYDLLNYRLSIQDTRKLPNSYGPLIKNGFDILTGNNDVVQFKQYEVVSIAKKYFELQYQFNKDYDLIL